MVRIKRRAMTQTRVHPETGKILRRDTRAHKVRFGAIERVVQAPGWYPEDDSDSLHSGADLTEADQALSELRAASVRHAP